MDRVEALADELEAIDWSEVEEVVERLGDNLKERIKALEEVIRVIEVANGTAELLKAVVPKDEQQEASVANGL